MTLAEKIIAFESGDMHDDDLVGFVQELIDTGLAWKLQGMYGRMAAYFIMERLCEHKESDHAEAS